MEGVHEVIRINNAPALPPCSVRDVAQVNGRPRDGTWGRFHSKHTDKGSRYHAEHHVTKPSRLLMAVDSE